MEYQFRDIEKKWQQWWSANKVYQVSNALSAPKYYVLDMFPYPSGTGLHVGHPLGYIASDIYSRYKRLKGFNVLHPMGFDSFGLPAEQYALDTGQHPATTTKKNITTFKAQLNNIGFCYDWSREIQTSDPHYYKWTQWIFLKLFGSFYNRNTNKAEPITNLVAVFEKEGNAQFSMPNLQYSITNFTKDEWGGFDEKTQQDILMQYRIAYCGYGEVNWCEALGTVLANDEVINGVSERGGYPVVKKKLRQWYLRITEYADRLLEGLEKVDFSTAMKEMQTNWIGKSEGAEIDFGLSDRRGVGGEALNLKVYTTRPDTIFGVDFMVIAPEHELVETITTKEQKKEVEEYIAHVKSRSERERMAEKKITGVFSGAYAINPLNGKEIPVWIAEYVLAGYGTGAIMGVPCGDERDHKFAKHFNIPITNIIGDYYNGEEANPTDDATLQNSDFLNGIEMRKAAEIVVAELELAGLGKRKVNYKMRDAAFSRQRYWGEPFPIIWKNGIAYPLDEKDLPLELPHVDSYKPGPDGEGPLANITEWALIPNPSPQVEKGAARVPKYAVHTPTQYELAKLMRKDHTEAEGKLWEMLRGNRAGAKFRRQHPIDAYIVDFVSLQDRLIVEADGGYHNTEEQKKYDEERTRILNDIGFKVIRFANEEILKNPYSVTNKIKSELGAQIPSPLVERGQGVRETNTMPGYAGSSWYFLRYMDPHNDNTFCDRKVSDYWNQVDLYIGGTEHAVGHLLYSRMWTKCLFDLGLIGFDEPYKKLMNQGMIQGSSRLIKRIQLLSSDEKVLATALISKSKSEHTEIDELDGRGITNKIVDLYFKDVRLNNANDVKHVSFSLLHVDVNIVDGNELDIPAYKKLRPELADAIYITEDDGRFVCLELVEKMSKSKYNVVNPDDLVKQYGADTFRMYEMFLGPVEMSKPWDTKGIEGVHRFLKKFWRLFADETTGLIVTNEQPTPEELKVLHSAIKKIESDTERFSFNTAVSAFMIATNELTDLKCHKHSILEPFLILLAPYAPHIAEELYQLLGSSKAPSTPGEGVGGEASILNATYPIFEAKYITETSKEYPISINGKLRTTMNISLDAPQSEIESIVMANAVVQKWLDGKPPKKIIFVKNKMINVVV